VWIETVLRQDDGRWLHLTNPTGIIETDRADDVLSTIAAVERAARSDDCYAVGFVAYEAGGAFGLVTQTPLNGLPLVWFALFERRTATVLNAPFANDAIGSYRVGALEASIDRERFMAAFTRIRAHLAAGDCYQANYTFSLAAAFTGDARALFVALCEAQRGRYAAFLNTGTRTICSASPELFFAREGGVLTARPMKGTAPRGLTADDDRRQRAALVTSAKERAENVMIVDMVRNDFGRIAEVGSVEVPELFTPEKYPTLWQMTSRVQARSSASLTALFAAMHPCASITGAPKGRTMEILAALEGGPRGVYTGAVGFVAPDGNACFSVAIRTAVVDHEAGNLTFGVGSGIVWDSDGPSEYDECLLKAAILNHPSRVFELLETMRWDPDAGFLVLGRLLGRLSVSAGYFDFAYDEPHVRAALDEAVRGARTSRRIRLLLSQTGRVRVEQVEWQRAPDPARVGLAKLPVHSRTVWLFHKTTHRVLYEERRRADVDETLLWNERGEVTEATTANLVALIGGRRLTPPVDAGLLPGTYRAELLARGAIEEAPIAVADLRRAERLWLINSVQEWRDATLID
jgi:para-aminobenzoate synthetase/4-amino-4-deoxychorismate lyase